MDPTGKATRAARSRQACAACKQTKQRCDGPNRIPCRRCELYGLECEYTSTGPAPKTALRPAVYPAHPPTAQDPAISDRLREIADRLHSIEATLATTHLSPNPTTTVSTPSLYHSHSQSPEDSHSPHSQHASDTPAPAATNPLRTVNETLDLIDKIEARTGEPTSAQGWGQHGRSAAGRTFNAMAGPDAILRGILSVEECEASFQMFFDRLGPWVAHFDLARDSHPAAMRERSPLLFHVILLSAAYYFTGTSERKMHIYQALTSLVNELVAPVLISPQPYQLNTDLVRSLALLLLYKPVQFASLSTNGIASAALAEQAAKLNSTTSSVLSGLIFRTALSISLPSICNTFAKSFDPSSSAPPELISDLRLWYWICIVDAHGALTTGRLGSLDIASTLRTTRLFASLKLQPYDVRLAAMVELYGTAKAAISQSGFAGARRVPPAELRKLNRDLDDFEAYWSAPLREASRRGDSLAWTVVSTFTNFIRIVVNSSVYTRWQAERKALLERGEDGRPELTTEDWSFLQTVVDSAEKLIFSLSMESRTAREAEREVNWPSMSGGPRGSLTLDMEVVESHRFGVDPVTCILYIFTLILVTKLINTGLFRCEFQALSEEYALGLTLDRPQRLVHGAKLGVLLELGASFLDAIAPTPTHPAKKHARMLRTIFAAGTMGQKLPVESFTVFPLERNPTGDAVFNPDAFPGFVKPAPIRVVDPHPSNAPGYPAPLCRAPHHEAGEALASVLNDVSTPAFFGDEAFFEAMEVEGAGQVDWEALERSLRMPVAGSAGVGGEEGYAGMGY